MRRNLSDDKISAMIQERDALREADLERLIDAAETSGILNKRFTKAEIVAFLKSYDPKDPRPSKSAQLTNKLEMMNMRQSQIDRKLDTRQKILLGAFLMDLLSEDTDARGTLLPKLKEFVKRGTPAQADRNTRAIAPLLESWEAGSASESGDE
jgi:hypothetical protein